ncbi:MAG TPA: hypothetical protein VMV10_19720 [Pirellulales bacterium]|nr:hypothetical protein [Pirellulales bacterium]
MARRVVHFGQRFLVAAIVLAIAVFAWRSGQTRDQREALKSLRHQNIIVHYDYQRTGSTSAGLFDFNPSAEPGVPRWLRGLLGDEYLYDVAYLEVARPYPPDSAIKDFMQRLPNCPLMYR